MYQVFKWGLFVITKYDKQHPLMGNGLQKLLYINTTEF